LAGPVHGRYAYEALEFESSVSTVLLTPT
jgi:hypothetical protein